MQQIINFLIKYRNGLLFIFLLFISLVFTIQSHSYHRSKFVNSANFISGGIYNWLDNINSYFDLKEHNQQLVEENKRLRERVYNSVDTLTKGFTDTLAVNKQYTFTIARVINNNYALRDNFLTLRGGTNDSIKPDQGVITSKGIVGIIDKTSSKYATVISILNSNSQINAKLKKSEHFGILVWDGKDPNLVKLIDVQQKAPVQKGDTIITGGMSTIFPKGIGIGTVEDYSLDVSENYYTITVKLFNDMTNIGQVYVIENTDQTEIKSIEQLTSDEQ